jgi:hypothetical protein
MSAAAVELQFVESPGSDEVRRRTLISQILEDARQQGQRRRFAVSAPPLGVALASTVVGILLLSFAEGDAPELLASAFLLVVAPVIILFAILPTDVRLVRLALVFLVAVNAAAIADSLAENVAPALWHYGQAACGVRFVLPTQLATALLVNLALFVILVRASLLLLSERWRWPLCCAELPAADERLARLWELNGQRVIVLAARRIAIFALSAHSYAAAALRASEIAALVGFVGVAVALAFFCLRPRVRLAARRWLFVRSESVSTAAGISMLFDSRFKDVDTAVSSAVASLRGVRCDLILKSALSGELSQSAAFLLSQPARVCGIDAFLCHSSRDPPGPKWDALQAWRGRFVALHGREPIVWLDRCCLDQSLRGVGLANLPITIASCQSLVVLYGPTVLSRLWCIVEIFVHQHMGGESFKLELVALPGVVAAPLGHVDAWQSDCHLPEDRVWLLACIETAAGSRAAFNARLRALLSTAQLLEPATDVEALPSASAHKLHSIAVAPMLSSLPLGLARIVSKREAAAPPLPSRTRTPDPARRGASLWPSLAHALAIAAAVGALAGLAHEGAAPARAECARCAGAYALPATAGGGQWHAWRGARYRLPPASEQVSHDAAARACAALGARLVVIDDAEEDAFVRCLVGDTAAAWIGLSREPAAAAFRWADGRSGASGYSNWVPDGVMFAEWTAPRRKCAYAVGAGWSVVGRSCNSALPFVCEAHGSGQ